MPRPGTFTKRLVPSRASICILVMEIPLSVEYSMGFIRAKTMYRSSFASFVQVHSASSWSPHCGMMPVSSDVLSRILLTNSSYSLRRENCLMRHVCSCAADSRTQAKTSIS